MTSRKVDFLHYHCRVGEKVQAMFVTCMYVRSTFQRIKTIDGCTKDFKQGGNRPLQHKIQGRRNPLQVLHETENQGTG